MKLIIYYIAIFVSINSCQTKKINPDIDIIENIPFSKKDFYKYDNGYLRDDPKKIDSFRFYIYTNVEPLDENKELPKKYMMLPEDGKKT